MGITGIDHWVIVAGNPERTLDFYRRLGFETGADFCLVWEGTCSARHSSCEL